MFHYGLTIRDVRQMPLTTFWMMSRNLDRIFAENDIREAEVSLRSQGDKEAVESLFVDLRTKMGSVIKYDEAHAPRDTMTSDLKAALNELGDLGNVSSRRAGT